jgi:DNA invertase Pin-like site-specific DNA recombinase
MSISNQRKILHDYAKYHNLEIVGEYVDDGVSGYTMNRPSFNRLKDDLNKDLVEVILVKDLSRLGRNDAHVQLFITNIVECDKQVLSLGENFDSRNESCLDTLGIHTWSNEKLVRDTSRKVRGSVATLQKEGKWLCSIPYGYVKDYFDKYKYYVEQTIAPYVKHIFDLYINGMGIKLIARTLTEENIPTPNMIRKMQAEAKSKVYKKMFAKSKWN